MKADIYMLQLNSYIFIHVWLQGSKIVYSFCIRQSKVAVLYCWEMSYVTHPHSLLYGQCKMLSAHSIYNEVHTSVENVGGIY